MPYRLPTSPHWAGLVKVAGAIRTILFVSVKGSVHFVSSSAKQRPGSKVDFHFFSQTMIQFLFNFRPNATFLFLRLLTQVTSGLLGVVACCHCLLDFSTPFSCLKGCLTRIFKKLYYCDFPCSFIPPSPCMKGTIMSLLCVFPPPLTLWTAPCQVTIVSHPQGLNRNSRRSSPWIPRTLQFDTKTFQYKQKPPHCSNRNTYSTNTLSNTERSTHRRTQILKGKRCF